MNWPLSSFMRFAFLHKRNTEAGVALLSVLAMVATMSLAATFALQATAGYVRTVKLARIQADQYWQGRSAQSLGAAIFEDVMQTTEGVLTDVYLAEQKPIEFPTSGGLVTITGFEASNCFNINLLGQDGVETLANGPASDVPENDPEDENDPENENDSESDRVNVNTPTLTSQAVQDAYIRLLQNLGADEDTARSLHDRLADWLDPDIEVRLFGAEDETYSLGPISHLAANAPMHKKADLRVINGYTQELVYNLAPMVCAYPTDAPILLNINTLLPEQAALLSALYAPELTPDEARNLISERPVGGWSDIESFTQTETIADLDPATLNGSVIGVTSRYIGFEIQLLGLERTLSVRYVYGMTTDSKPRLIFRERL